MVSGEYMMGYDIGKELISRHKQEINDLGWLKNKQLATIADKAIKFSERSKKPLLECMEMKFSEMKKGYILAKDYSMEYDLLRGLVAGWILKKNEINDDVIVADIIIKIEDKRNVTWFDNENHVDNVAEYMFNLKDEIRRKMYESLGLITLQELTRRCLQMMNTEENKEKYVMCDVGQSIYFKGNFDTSNISIGRINMDERIDKNDIILIS